MPTHRVPIFADGDQERLSELRRAVVVAERHARATAGESRRLGDDHPADEVEAAQAAYDAFIDEAADRAEEWVLGSIGFAEFRKLLREHPARQVAEEAAEDGTTTKVMHPDDAAWGVNVEEFPKALLLFVDPEDDDIRTVVELKAGTRNIAKNADALRKRVKRLSEGQFEALWTNAFVLNKAGVSDPKLDRFSLATPRSSET